MDIQFWIWLIVIVVTLISKFAKKKEEQNIPQDHAPDDGRSGRPDFNPKPVTFEELLKEIQAAKAPAKLPPAPRKVEYVDYDDNLEEEEKDLERTDYNYRDDSSIYETYEKAKQAAFVKPSLEDTLKLKDTDMTFGQFKGYQHVEQKSPASEILKDFHDPEGFKKAFIMSEILKTKF